jgi:hypothetical protein
MAIISDFICLSDNPGLDGQSILSTVEIHAARISLFGDS